MFQGNVWAFDELADMPFVADFHSLLDFVDPLTSTVYSSFQPSLQQVSQPHGCRLLLRYIFYTFIL